MKKAHKEILKEISTILENHPDLRFNQALYILQGGYAINKGHCRIENNKREIGYDLFNVEDNDFLKSIKAQGL